jgi:hypothetical protein
MGAKLSSFADVRVLNFFFYCGAFRRKSDSRPKENLFNSFFSDLKRLGCQWKGSRKERKTHAESNKTHQKQQNTPLFLLFFTGGSVFKGCEYSSIVFVVTKKILCYGAPPPPPPPLLVLLLELIK